MTAVDAPTTGCAAAVQAALSETQVVDKIAAWRRAQSEAHSLEIKLRRAGKMIGVADRINIFTTSAAEEREAALRVEIEANAAEMGELRQEAAAAVVEVEQACPPLGLWRRVCELVSEVKNTLPAQGPEASALEAIAKSARELAAFIRTTWILRPTTYDPWARAMLRGQASLARHVELAPRHDPRLHWAALDRREIMALLCDGAVPPDAAAPWAPEFGLIRRRCPPLGLYLDATGVEGAAAAVREGAWAFDRKRLRPVTAVERRAAVAFAVARLRRRAAAALRPMPLPNLSLREAEQRGSGQGDEASLALDAALERGDLLQRLETYVDFAAAAAAAARASLSADATVTRVVGDAAERADLERARRVGRRLERTLSDRWDRVVLVVEESIDAQPELRLANEASRAWSTITSIRGRARSITAQREAALEATREVQASMEVLLGVAGDEDALMGRVATAIREGNAKMGTPLDHVVDALRDTGFPANWHRLQEIEAELETLASERRALERRIDVLDTLSPFQDTEDEVALRAVDSAHARLTTRLRSTRRLVRVGFLEARMKVRRLDLYLRLRDIQTQLADVDVQLEWAHAAPSQVRGVAEARHAMDTWYQDAVQHLEQPRQAEQALLAWVWRRN